VNKCIFHTNGYSITQKRIIPKCSKCIGNDLGISYKCYGLGLKDQRSRLGLGLTAIRRGFELYECLLVLTTFN